MALQDSFDSLRGLLIKPLEVAKEECPWFDLIYNNTQPALSKPELSRKHDLPIVKETKELWDQFKENLEAVDAKLKLSSEAVKLMDRDPDVKLWRNQHGQVTGGLFAFTWFNSISGTQASSGSSNSNSYVSPYTVSWP